jgi:hypothetical protein
VTFTKDSHEGTTHVSIIRVNPGLKWEVDPDFKAKK